MRSLFLRQAADLMGHSLECPSLPVQGYCIDSRLLQEGELFFALKGERVDGHDYLQDVYRKGAIAAVVSKEYPKKIPGLLLIPVEDPLESLQKLTYRVLKSGSARIVAITGSVGKTTTKEMVTHLLSTQYKVACSPANHNSQVGLPLSVLNHTNGQEEILVLEMGMTSSGHLKRLVQMAPPEVSILTSVALVHACNFRSIEEIAWTKSEIFSHPETKLGILSREIPDFHQICSATSCDKRSFSLFSSLGEYGLDPADFSYFLSRLENKRCSLKAFSLPGKHNLHNLIAALAAACYFKVDSENLENALGTLSLPEKRLQFTRYKNCLFVNDSYNASEVSVKAALEVLPKPENNGRRLAVLGSMLELGTFSDDCHQRVGEFALDRIDVLYCLGEECEPMVRVWKNAGRSVCFFQDRLSLVASLREQLKEGDVVLLKGSRSKELWKVLGEL